MSKYFFILLLCLTVQSVPKKDCLSDIFNALIKGVTEIDSGLAKQMIEGRFDNPIYTELETYHLLHVHKNKNEVDHFDPMWIFELPPSERKKCVELIAKANPEGNYHTFLESWQTQYGGKKNWPVKEQEKFVRLLKADLRKIKTAEQVAKATAPIVAPPHPLKPSKPLPPPPPIDPKLKAIIEALQKEPNTPFPLAVALDPQNKLISLKDFETIDFDKTIYDFEEQVEKAAKQSGFGGKLKINPDFKIEVLIQVVCRIAKNKGITAENFSGLSDTSTRSEWYLGKNHALRFENTDLSLLNALIKNRLADPYGIKED